MESAARGSNKKRKTSPVVALPAPQGSVGVATAGSFTPIAPMPALLAHDQVPLGFNSLGVADPDAHLFAYAVNEFLDFGGTAAPGSGEQPGAGAHSPADETKPPASQSDAGTTTTGVDLVAFAAAEFHAPAEFSARNDPAKPV